MASTRQILLLMDERFVDEIDAAYPSLGFSDRATFIRDAVLKELARKDIHLPAAYRAAPPRVGASKGGRPKKAVLTPVEGTGLKKPRTAS